MKKLLIRTLSLTALVGITAISAKMVRAEAGASLERTKQESGVEFGEMGGPKAGDSSAVSADNLPRVPVVGDVVISDHGSGESPSQDLRGRKCSQDQTPGGQLCRWATDALDMERSIKGIDEKLGFLTQTVVAMRSYACSTNSPVAPCNILTDAARKMGGNIYAGNAVGVGIAVLVAVVAQHP